MTEPTQEQVERERERAHGLVKYCQGQPVLAHAAICDDVATALARLRIEAEADGRNKALDDATRLVARFGDLNGLLTGGLCDEINALGKAR